MGLLTAQASPESNFLYNYATQKKNSVLLEKKKNVLIFLSTKCPCSNSHIEHLKNLASEFSDFQFIGIHSNQNESQDEGQIYFSAKKLSFPVYRDLQTKWADQFGALKTPHVFVTDKAGKIIYAGPISDHREFSKAKRHYLKDFLVSRRENIPFEPVKKRPLGCFIVR